ncbi:Synaptotagmin-7 [Araneus ventricosus]|uniref:Synaptotagmin-7 n=1 Tax=Araneus ventricosus TaxID=182803 RepID=A0A4Y2EHC2_ARAVE|nr:Synaptotagmin-7 [Araneus ventricosus]
MRRDCFQYASKTRRPKCLLPYKISSPELVYGKLPSFRSIPSLHRHLRMRMELNKASKNKVDGKPKDMKPGASSSTSMLQALVGNDEDYDEVDTSEPLEPAGQIQFSLEYDFYASTLILRIIQGRDLPAKDIIGTSDPYVKVTLLPDKKRKLETKVKHRTLNPRWNETFYFEGFPLHKLQKSILHLNVYDWDRFSRDDPIGDVYLPLAQVDLTQKPTFWKSLKPAETCKQFLSFVSGMGTGIAMEEDCTITQHAWAFASSSFTHSCRSGTSETTFLNVLSFQFNRSDAYENLH